MNDDQAVAVESEEYSFTSESNIPGHEDPLPTKKPPAKKVEAVNDEVDDVEDIEDIEEEDEDEVEDEDIEDTEEDDDESEEDEPTDTDYEEVELSNGKKVSVPKEVRDQMMMQADYTQKTQSLAESKRVQAQREELFHDTQAKHQVNFKLHTELATLESQIAEYENVDWVALAQQDPALAQQHQVIATDLQRKRQGLVNNLEQSENELNEKRGHFEQANSQQIVDGCKGLIENYTPETGRKIAEYAVKNLNFTPEIVQSINQGRIPPVMAVPLIKAVNDSMKLAEMLDKAKRPVKKKQITPPVAKVRGARKKTANAYSKNLTSEQRIKLWQKGKK